MLIPLLILVSGIAAGGGFLLGKKLEENEEERKLKELHFKCITTLVKKGLSTKEALKICRYEDENISFIRLMMVAGMLTALGVGIYAIAKTEENKALVKIGK